MAEVVPAGWQDGEATVSTPGDMADAFTHWAQARGILPGITADQARVLAEAFAAGYWVALGVTVPAIVAGQEGGQQ